MIEQEKSENYQHNLALFQATSRLDSKEKQLQYSQNYRKAYILSLLIPPLGIYYFIKYLFFTDGDEGSIRAGIIALILTLASFFLSIILTMILFRQTTSGIPSHDIQMLKDLTIPENQKKLLELYE